MNERKHPDALCEECPLYEGGRYVPSAGSGVAGIACVGEAPGIQEARQGVPFVGPSGKLLKIVLKHHGIDPEDVFYSNATLCRPPDGSAPPLSAIRACRPRLTRELNRSGVESIILLGNSAAQSYLGEGGITQLRVGPAKRIGNHRVVPTIHPAACLRQGDQFPFLVTDIGKVKDEPPVFTEPTYVVADTVGDALELMDAIDERLESGGCAFNPEKVLVIDIEVDIEKDAGGFGHPNQYGMLCVGIGYDRHKVLVLSEGVMGEKAVLDRLRLLLKRWRIVCQNGKFDLAGLYPLLGGLRLWFDTMLASYAFDERPGVHGLKWQAKEYLGAPDYDKDIKFYVGTNQGYGAIPRDLLYRYNAFDVACTFSMYELWSARFGMDDGRDARALHDFLVEASNELMYVELNGISVDKGYLRELDAKFLEELHGIEDRAAEFARRDYDKRGGINLRSPMQIKAYLADNGINVKSTDEDNVMVLLGKKLPRNEEQVKEFLTTLLEHRGTAKLHGTYVKGIAKRLYGGRIYPTFLLHGTTTGRLSCRNPNLQNIPRGNVIKREFVVSKPERVFIQTDYSQAELRVMSYLAGDQYFRNIFNAGELDVFDDLTPILYPGMTKDKVSKDEWKEIRIRVKAFVYGLNYGRTEFSIAKEYGIPVPEAQQLKRNFFNVIPEIVTFQGEVWEKVKRGEELVNPRGRHRRYSLITNENKDSVKNESLAFLPQSTASDMCLQAMIWTRQETKGFAWIRNIVHDSILIECHEDDAAEVVQIQERNMIKAAEAIVGDYVKFAVDTETGKNWGDLVKWQEAA